MFVTDAPGQVWASISTNVQIRTTPEPGESSSRPNKRVIPWFGISVQSTSITLQPGLLILAKVMRQIPDKACVGAIECLAGLFVHYLDSLERGKIAIRDALGPSKPQINSQPDEFSFLIRVTNTMLSVPLATTVVPNGSGEPNITAALESFVLFGEVTNVSGSAKLSRASPIPSPPRRLLGTSHFSSLQLRLRDGYPLEISFLFPRFHNFLTILFTVSYLFYFP